MANYTAADVKKLRDLTGSGMMDCKRAIEESDGDLDKAVELLSSSYDVSIGSVERGWMPGRVYFKAVTLRTRASS